MAWYNFWKNKNTNKSGKVLLTQNGSIARVGSFGDNLLASDTIQQCIAAIAKEMKKLEPRHVRFNVTKTTCELVNDDLNKLLKKPNENMTTSDFLEKIIWILYARDNCFIYPEYEIKMDDYGALKRKYKSFRVILYDTVELQTNDRDDVVNVKFYYPDGSSLLMPYSNVIHLKRNFGLNDVFGGDKFGKPNNDALLKTVQINHNLLDSVEEGIKASYAINGILKYNTMLADDKMSAAIDKFNESLENNKSRIVPLDMKAEYVPVTRDVKMVDKDTLDFLDKKILRNYGVSQNILDGTATAEEKRAFYETTLEPLITSLNQVFTNHLFSDYELARGNEIVFYYNKAETMTNQQKIEQITIMSNVGAITRNEIRELLGYPPMETEAGNEYIYSLNYGEVSKQEGGAIDE